MIALFKTCLFYCVKIPRFIFHFIKGQCIVFSLPRPVVTIFGGARFAVDDFYFKQTHILAERLSRSGISVLTGGGSGIMNAANCGVFHVKKGSRSVGIGVTDLGDGRNACAIDYIELDYFFARKFLLINYSDAFVFFPGGYGTLNELSEVLMLIQTKKLKKSPVLLVGVEYRLPFMRWLENELQLHGAIEQKDLDLFVMTDDLDYVHKTICCQCSGKEER